jgi:hypothetical protein
MQNCHYGPLTYPLRQIRLVRLLPQWTAPGYVGDKLLRCELSPYLLEDCPEYTALSYTWGDLSRTSSIIVNGTVNHVTKSVEIALRHLQHQTDAINLWIDQLCINQTDVVEKSQQVQLMKDIYEGAAQVVVWLGPAADKSDQLIDFLTEVGKEAHNSGLMQVDLSSDKCNLAFTDSQGRLAKRLELGLTFPVEDLRSFTARPWWTRVCVVQELSVAQEVILPAERSGYPISTSALLCISSCST